MTENELHPKETKKRKTVTAPKEQTQEELGNGCVDLSAQSAVLEGALRCQSIQNRGVPLEIKSHHNHQTRPYSDISFSDENDQVNESDDDNTSIHMEYLYPITTTNRNRNRIFPSLLFPYHDVSDDAGGGIDRGAAAICACTESVDSPCSSGLSMSLGCGHDAGNGYCVGFGSIMSSHSCNLHEDFMECLACEEQLCPICVRDFMK